MWLEISLWALLAVMITFLVVCSIFALLALFSRGSQPDDEATGTEAISDARVLYLLSRERNEQGRI